jgi:hypothetical protein
LGKVQAVERVDENDLINKQKKQRKRREGQGGMYEEDTSLTIEVSTL